MENDQNDKSILKAFTKELLELLRDKADAEDLQELQAREEQDRDRVRDNEEDIRAIKQTLGHAKTALKWIGGVVSAIVAKIFWEWFGNGGS